MLNPNSLKNKELRLQCLRLGSNLEGVASHEGYTLFVNNALPGEDIFARVEKVEKRYGYAKLLQIRSASSHRTVPQCEHYAYCGGCSAQHMDYDYQLTVKSALVKDYFYKNAKLNVDVPKTLGAKDPWYSRNKTSLPVREVDGKARIGFYRKRSHHIVDIAHCPIAHTQVSNIIGLIRRWMHDYRISAYNEQKHTGMLRHIVIRNNSDSEIMIVLVSKDNALPYTNELIAELKEKINGFVSLYLNINTQQNNVILGQDHQLLYGKSVLQQKICDLSFEISPLSFMQVNGKLTETLYQTAIEMANIGKDDVCIDAYCGAGTISLILARHAKKVYGIEVIRDAINNANNNAVKNHIYNAEFICGTVEQELPKLIQKGVVPNVLLLDPPRKGIEASIISAIADTLPDKILYISCNPATQARDIALMLPLGYELQKVQPVDMFCMSSEVESICLLSKSH